MDSRPIGVFDSGLGGLTAVSRLSELLPGEDIIYLGDTGRVPYGSKSKDTIIKYAKQDIAFLRTFNIKAIVVACGTVSATALPVIGGDYNIPIFGVVEAASRGAVNATRNGKIGVIATQASINSGVYEKMVKEMRPGTEVYSKACPLFVPLVENGRTKPGDIVIETIVAEYLQCMKDAGVDTLILGCTHYPLLTEVISDYLGDGVTLINSGAETAQMVNTWLADEDLYSDKNEGTHKFFVTDSVESFTALASAFLQSDIRGEVEKVDLNIF